MKAGIEAASDDQQRAFWARLSGESAAMLATHGDDGMPVARPVQPVRIEPGRLWIFTAVDGDIADDIRRSADVHVIFANHARELYASLNGSARLMLDASEARALWSPLAGAWYPGGPDDPNLALLRIDVHRADYWDMKDGKLVRTIKLAAATMTSTQADDIATHRRFEQ